MFPHALIAVVAVGIVLAVLLWALTQFPALDATIVRVIRILLILCYVLWALNLLFGGFIFGGGGGWGGHPCR